MDSVGQIVLPKSLRDALGLRGETTIDDDVVFGLIDAEIVA